MQLEYILFSETVVIFQCAGSPSRAERPSRNVSELSTPASRWVFQYWFASGWTLGRQLEGTVKL